MSRTLGSGLSRGGLVIIETAAGQTTDATTDLVLWTYDIGDLQEVCAVFADIAYVEDVSSPTIYGTRSTSIFAYGNGSTTATSDATNDIATHNTGTAPALYAFSVSGTNVRLVVRGVAATTINWAASITFIRSGDTT
jgi:hypothetical protein